MLFKDDPSTGKNIVNECHNGKKTDNRSWIFIHWKLIWCKNFGHIKTQMYRNT